VKCKYLLFEAVFRKVFGEKEKSALGIASADSKRIL
jgi:hypothetical protein